jgi:3-dehydroshikimate dehydratase
MLAAMTHHAVGLCSVTFRALSPAEVLDRAARAGLAVIEWGNDVHAPDGDQHGLRDLRSATERAGLRTCSYGSYFEAGTGTDERLPALIVAATLLGAPRIRVWPGVVASGRASADERRAVVDSLRAAADLAAPSDISIALEYHEGSLTDTSESTLQLLGEVARDNVSTYWQAPHGLSDADALETLRAVAPYVSAVHAFAWDEGGGRHPLRSRASFWEGVVAVLDDHDRQAELLIEFVPDDDPDVLEQEADALRAAVGARA